MFGKRLRLFKVLGFEIRADASWILLAILITWSLAQGMFPHSFPSLPVATYWWMGAVGAIGLFLSILLHELSHSLVARHYGLPMGGITLFIFGGVAEMEGEPARPGVEFQMALMGPVVSILLGAVFYGLYRIGAQSGWAIPVVGVLSYLYAINFLLAFFNLVPAFPLDGGRLLRSALWKWEGNLEKATRQASLAGTAFAYVLIALGAVSFFYGNFFTGMWWILIGMFLKSAARSSYQQVLVRDVLSTVTVERFIEPNVVTVEPHVSLQDFARHYILRLHHKMFPVLDKDLMLGCALMADLRRFPKEEWDRHTVSEILRVCDYTNSVGPGTGANEALVLMNRSGEPCLPVVDGKRLLGIITLKDLLSYISTRIEIHREFRQAA